MKRAIVILAFILTFGNLYANEEKVSIDEKLIKEVKAEMEKPFYFIDSLEEEPDVLVYSIEGKLLHSFQKENIDPIAMRNADFIMETNSQKIFIKMTELNPNI
ncbi:hypothetical protein MATR_36290 [Marivirga tractuosa]|uniref:Uncharacterized protein n=1 Tax=Marivirga tractuosa (strain ATCC 23168 / DSM 4126 / NBRC 15989 / NCIMB 1408 / VKM B-1430 / H-43) TaxID=643867 RepID=E4TNW1_MARTH|nr:hypothetical protein [Marivirga tractuosa]ADR22525.1 hypothetical protein Ftrac_2547 [Marivirga tractuosa DSM 4126]BDD16804.1 hypothetical protein MATR_36290 [Marivirga tractuosa]